MAKAALAFAAGFGGGYLGAKRQAELDEERRADRARIQEEHDYRKAERQRIEGERIALANAAKPVQMEEGAGGMIRPPTMDDRDVGLAENAPLPDQGLQRGGYRVQGQTYTERAPAEQAMAQANTPDARRLRQAAVLDQQGRPDQAITLENAVVAQRGKKQEAEDAAWRRSIGVAIQGGHDGLAELATKTEVGPFAGKKAKAVPSADGKTVTYHLIEGDKLVPTGLTFPNNQEGVVQAAYMMDRAIAPKDRMEGARKDKELERRAGDSEARHAYQLGQLELKGKQVELQGELGAARIEAAKARAAAGGGRPGAETRVQSVKTDKDGNMIAVMRDGSTKELGVKSSDFNKQVANTIAKMEQDFQFKRLPEEEKVRRAVSRITLGESPKAPALADVQPKPGGKPKPATAPVKVTTQAEHAALPKDTRYVAPDGTVRVKN